MNPASHSDPATDDVQAEGCAVGTGRRLRLLLVLRVVPQGGFCSSDSNFPNLVLKFYPGECDNEYVGAAGQYPSQFAVSRPDPCPAGRPARLRPAFFHSAARLRL